MPSVNEQGPVDTQPLWDQLHNLRMLVDVSGHDSLGGAARALNRTTSTVARAIRQLEEALSIALFERHAQGVRTSRAGRIVADRAHAIMAELQEAAGLFVDGASAGVPTLHNVLYVLGNGHKLMLIRALAEKGTVWGAAERLGLTRSAVSMALARVESLIGRPLFARGRQGLEPTSETLLLLDRIKRIDAEMRHLDAELASGSHAIAGVVVVGTLSTARTLLFPIAIERFVRRHPHVRIKTFEASFDTMVGALRSGEVDFTIGVVRDTGEHRGLEIDPVMTDMLGVIARADNPLARLERPSLRDLHAAHWILPRPRSRGARLIGESFSAAGLAPPVPTVETADLQIIRQLLLSSDMLAMASPHQLMFELQAGLLRQLPIALDAGRREIAILSRKGARLSPAALGLMAAVREAAAALPARASGPARAPWPQPADREQCSAAQEHQHDARDQPLPGGVAAPRLP